MYYTLAGMVSLKSFAFSVQKREEKIKFKNIDLIFDRKARLRSKSKAWMMIARRMLGRPMELPKLKNTYKNTVTILKK